MKFSMTGQEKGDPLIEVSLCLNFFHPLAQKPNLEEEKNLFKQILS
jgi:hypothetical protein